MAAAPKCCPCNGAKAKCNRCICVRRKTPCVSCLPGKSSCCQNSLCNRQERSVSSVVVSSSRTTCPAGPGLLSQSVSSSNSRSSLSFGNSLRGSVTNANDSVGVLRESVGENKAVISSPASQALAGPIFLSNNGHFKKLLMIINFNNYNY